MIERAAKHKDQLGILTRLCRLARPPSRRPRLLELSDRGHLLFMGVRAYGRPVLSAAGFSRAIGIAAFPQRVYVGTATDCRACVVR
jgi:hypothetical protein